MFVSDLWVCAQTDIVFPAAEKKEFMCMCIRESQSKSKCSKWEFLINRWWKNVREFVFLLDSPVATQLHTTHLNTKKDLGEYVIEKQKVIKAASSE